MSRARSLLIDRGLLLGLVAFAAYAWLVPAWVVDGDNAELSGLGAIGGIAHPSGYPLTVLWLRVWSWLPGTPAHAAGLATALLAAMAIVVLHAACRAWGARPAAATVACALVAASPIAMRVATEAEVFAGNELVAAAVLSLAAREGPLRGGRRAAVLGLVAGLGLANHLSCVFVAPVGLLGLVRAVREARPRAISAIGLAVLGLAVGLLPYLYAFAAPDTPLSWGAVRDLDGLAGLILRRDYGTGSLVAHGAGAPVTASLAALARTLGRAWLWLPLVAAAAAFATRLARPRDTGEPRWGWAMLLASFVIAGPVFVARFNAAPEGIGLYIVHRFHVLPSLLLAIPVAVGLDAAAVRLPERVRALGRLAAPLAATVGFAAAAALSLPYLARVHSAALEDYCTNTLRMLPPGSIVVVSPDAFYFGLEYAQWARGERQDVVVVGWPLMARPWYRERMAALGIVGDPIDAPPLVQLAHHLAGESRPLFVEPTERAVERALPTYPVGPLVRVVPRGARAPALGDVVAANREIYAHFALAYPRPGRDDEWATVVHDRYAATWATLARALAAAGRRDDAEQAAETARELGPAGGGR